MLKERWKKVVSGFLTMAMMVTPMSGISFAAEGETAMVVKAEDVSAELSAGDKVSVDVKATKNKGYATAQIIVEWDSEALKLSGVKYTDIAPDLGGAPISEAKGEYTVAIGNELWTQSQTGTGTLFTLDFEILSGAKAGESYPISMSPEEGNCINADMEEITLECEPGSITFKEKATSSDIPTPTSAAKPTATPKPTSAPKQPTATPKPTSAPTATPKPTGTPEATVLKPEATISSDVEKSAEEAGIKLSELQEMAESTKTDDKALNDALKQSVTAEDEKKIEETVEEYTKKIKNGEIKDVPANIQKAIDAGEKLQGYPVAFLEFNFKDCEKIGEVVSISVDISAMKETRITTGDISASGVTKENSISADDKTEIPVAVAIKIELKLPSAFSGKRAFVQHTKESSSSSKNYWYKAEYSSSTGNHSFNNPHGLSSFNFSTADGANIWDTNTNVGYKSLQDAIDDVNASSAIMEVNDSAGASDLKATIGRKFELTLKNLIESQLANISLTAGSGLKVTPGSASAIKKAAVESGGKYTVKFSITTDSSSGSSSRSISSSGGGGGGSSSSGSGISGVIGGSSTTNSLPTPGTWRQEADGSWRFIGVDGVTPWTNSWIVFNRQWYFVGPDGRMLTGWQMINGVYYYFSIASINGQPIGSLYMSRTTPDNYNVDANGVWHG